MKLNHTVPLLSLISVLIVSGCTSDPDQRPGSESLPVNRVKTERFEAELSPDFVDFPGTIKPYRSSVIESRIPGRIATIQNRIGTEVQPNEVLVTLDAEEIHARQQQSLAHLHQAERDMARHIELFEDQAITQEEFDTIKTSLEVAQASAREAEIQVQYLSLKAPFKGRIARRFAVEGDLAMPGKPLLHLESDEGFMVHTSIPESLMDHVQPGLSLPVHVDALESTRTARVMEIAPNAAGPSHTFHVKLAIDFEAVQSPVSGLFCRVSIPSGTRQIFSIPESAIITRGQMKMVFTVENSRARMNLVKTGRRSSPDRIEILSGQTPGSRVITEAESLLLDGQPVETDL